ncbi:MAG TPA: Spy/CpxP family protein refolding chaperone [Stellaceae bacterium]|jgi:periplasmic protein CpxP/Spy|nr:Spy/CpxP family protein refolding chaperone [Stellaceae bacterium]
MTVSRTILAFAAAVAIGPGIVSSPFAHAQSGNQTTPPAARSAAPMRQTPSTVSENLKPRSDAQVEARIAQLHKELKITKDQESDWNALAQDMRDNGRAMSSEIQARNGTKPMNAVDNLKSYARIADTHADGLKKIVPDFEKLYDSMSPEQKKTADTVFNQRVNQRVRTTAAPSSGNHS